MSREAVGRVGLSENLKVRPKMETTWCTECYATIQRGDHERWHAQWHASMNRAQQLLRDDVSRLEREVSDLDYQVRR